MSHQIEINVTNNHIHGTPWSSTIHRLFSTYDKKSMAIKVFCSILGFYSLFGRQWIGIVLVMCIFSVDFFISRIKTDSFGFLLKMLLLFQGLAIWYIAAHSVSKLSFADTSNHFISNKYAVDAHVDSELSKSDSRHLGTAAAYPPVNHHINQHSPHRIEHEPEPMSHEGLAEDSQQQQQHYIGGSNHKALRGKAAFVEPFSLEGLAPAPPISESWTLGAREKYEKNEIEPNSKPAHQSLCNAAVLLDLAAVKFLLYDYKVPPDSVVESDARRNAFHCLSSLYLHADASPTSLVFSLLKGTQSWATKLYDPPLSPQADSIVSSEVLNALESQMEKVAQYLQRAGVPATLKDAGGNTPLHYAAYGGSLSIMRVLIDMGADVNAMNNDQRTPAHFALAQGQAAAGSLLFYAKADMDIKDKNRVTPRDLVVNPGPIYPADAIKYFEMEQRPAKQIERVIHPELHPRDIERGGWAAGTGNWSTQRLKGYEEDMECKVVDQYWAHEITADDIFYKYLSRNAPVLIRGLIDNWGVVEEYKQKTLLSHHGHLNVAVSDIPYSQKFGGDGSVDMTLGAYIDSVNKHTTVGGSHPWYVFKGHPIPSGSDEDPESLVPIENCKTPEVIQAAFGDEGDMDDRGIFVNAQWALGGEGTGAPVHFHNTAWNALIYGAKKWAIYPPRDKIMSNEQILEFTEDTQTALCNRGVCAVTCTQVAGDVMIIPESWGHGVLNVQQSIAVATEVRGAMWRITPSVRSIQNARQEAIRLGYMPASAGRRDRNMKGGGPEGSGRGGGRGDAPPSARGVGAHYPPSTAESSAGQAGRGDRGRGDRGGAGRGRG